MIAWRSSARILSPMLTASALGDRSIANHASPPCRRGLRILQGLVSSHRKGWYLGESIVRTGHDPAAHVGVANIRNGIKGSELRYWVLVLSKYEDWIRAQTARGSASRRLSAISCCCLGPFLIGAGTTMVAETDLVGGLFLPSFFRSTS